MLVRLSAGAAALALAACMAPRPALAQQEEPIVVNIAGPCVIALDGEPRECTDLALMAFPSNHRIDLTAITGQTGWAFSGEDDDNDDGHYTLTLDSVLNPQAGRVEAEGQCEMQVAGDGRTVTDVECDAMTSAGEMTLKASGVASGEGDADDGDDEDDDSGQG